MKNKLKNAVMLAIIASAMIACSGGSGSGSAQSQPPSPNVQLPEPEVLDSEFSNDMSAVGSAAAPFLASLTPVVTTFIPGLAEALGVAQFATGLINLFDPSGAQGLIITQLDQISNQIQQLDSQMLTEINLTRAGFYGLFETVDDFQKAVFSANLSAQLTTINADYSTVKGAYNKFVNTGIFGKVTYSNAIKGMYSYASSHCTNTTGIVEFSQMHNLNSLQFNAKYINDGYYWSDFIQDRQSYIYSLTLSPESDIALGLSNYNLSAFSAMSQLFAAFDEMRLMQLAQAAYYYACPGNIDSTKITQNFLNNLAGANNLGIPTSTTLSSESTEQRYESYKNVAKFIYTAYDKDFQTLKQKVATNLAPIPNQYLEYVINNKWFSSLGTSLLTSSFGESAPLGSIPHQPYDCNVNKFSVESTNTSVNMTAICLIESDSTKYTYRTVNHAIPIKMSSLFSIESTYGYTNLYYDKSRQTIKSPASNLNIPVSSSTPGYLSSSSDNPSNVTSLNGYNIVAAESRIYVFGSPWTNFPYTASSCGSWTNEDGATSPECAGANMLVSIPTFPSGTPTYGYKTAFWVDSSIVGTSVLATASGTWATQAYYYASYNGHLFLIQFLTQGTYGPFSGTYMSNSNNSYIAIRCATGDCTAASLNSGNNPFQQLTWSDGTQIQLNNSSLQIYETPTLMIQVTNTPNNIITRKLFKFESDNQVATWMESPTHLHHKAYLNGKIKYTLKAGVESTPIFVSKNYAYRLAYIANGSSGSLQIQSNNNDGTWNTTLTVATAPNGATNLYLNHGDISLVNSTTAGESVVWSISQQYRANNIQWAPDIYAEAMVTNHGQLNIYAWDANNQAGVSGTSPDDANYSRMLWSSSNFSWSAVNHGTLLQPQGSYTQTCSSVNWAQPILSATCLNISATTTSTTLDYYSCNPNSTVSNQNGVLTCDTPNKSK